MIIILSTCFVDCVLQFVVRMAVCDSFLGVSEWRLAVEVFCSFMCFVDCVLQFMVRMAVCDLL